VLGERGEVRGAEAAAYVEDAEVEVAVVCEVDGVADGAAEGVGVFRSGSWMQRVVSDCWSGIHVESIALFTHLCGNKSLRHSYRASLQV
jgi:hypothetical protein